MPDVDLRAREENENLEPSDGRTGTGDGTMMHVINVREERGTNKIRRQFSNFMLFLYSMIDEHQALCI